METTYYTLTAREILVEGAAVQRASGDGARQLVCVRKAAERTPAGGGKVIDLAAWKADREEVARLEEEWYGDVAEEAFDPDYEDASEQSTYAPRKRRSHKIAAKLEMLSCVAVIGVMAVLLVRILLGF